MANRAIKAHSKSSAGNEVTLHQQETDAPILPIAQLERLHSFRPDLVDFVVDETRNEAQHRRSLERFGYQLTFAERTGYRSNICCCSFWHWYGWINLFGNSWPAGFGRHYSHRYDFWISGCFYRK